jgi:hypothetical protein
LKYLSLICIVAIACWCMTGCNESSTEPAPSGPEDLLPESGELTGWEWDGDPIVGDTRDDLYDIIDGGADLYIDNGMKEFAFQAYAGEIAGNASQIEILIYDMADSFNVKNVYVEVAIGTEEPWDEVGDEARIDERFTGWALDFHQDKYLVEIDILQTGDDALEVGKLFAQNISGKI